MHLSKLHEVVEKGEFSLDFVSEKGEKIKIKKAICTTFHSKGTTLNIMLIPSGEKRTVRRITITKFNGQEVYL
jgi:ribosomal protein L23